jgi:TusA-related sulfurtransferase
MRVSFTSELYPHQPRFWRKLPDFSISPSHDARSIAEDDPNHSTLSYFSMLYTASETRKKIMEVISTKGTVKHSCLTSTFQGLSEVKVVPRLRIMTALVEDNIKVGKILQLLSNRPSYKKDVPNLPKEYALAALNLIHYVRKSSHDLNTRFSLIAPTDSRQWVP